MNEKTTIRTGPKASPSRIAGHTKAAELLREYILGAARKGLALVKCWSIDLGVSEQYFRRLIDPLESKDWMYFGDVQALPPGERGDLYRFFAAKADAELMPPPTGTDPLGTAMAAANRAMLASSTASASISEQMRNGGSPTAEEAQKIADSYAEGARELESAARAMYAARDSARKTERKAG